jgi:predicted regulator of Ras-like GTPase activity (Roadblock/LC7/MglB family)
VLFNDLVKDFYIPGPGVSRDRFPGPGEQVSPHVYRGDLLEDALVSMCRRGDFKGSVLVDNNGLPLAIYNTPVEADALAAFTSILGRSLEETGRLFDQPNANNISMDINYIDKVVLQKFLVDDVSYFLMIISPQEVDVRAELELSINHISPILKEK